MVTSYENWDIWLVDSVFSSFDISLWGAELFGPDYNLEGTAENGLIIESTDYQESNNTE